MSIFQPDEALSYGPIRGSPKLRELISDLYQPPPGSTTVTFDDILTTSGAISANHLVLDTLISPGDHVIVQYPTYGQLFLIPRRAGAEVSFWRQRQRDGLSASWTLDIQELASLIRLDTKLIILNNPSNPTGMVIPRYQLEEVVALAKSRGITIMSDEVFRPLFHSHDEPPPSLLDLGYERSIVVGSMSKAYALPGIRVGWVAMPSCLRDSLLQQVVEARDYTTIAVSQLDQQVATAAMLPSVRENILARSKRICDKNVSVLRDWLDKHSERVSAMVPEGAGTGVIMLLGHDGHPIDDATFAATLAREEGVLAPPTGLCFGHESEHDAKPDLKGGLRIGVIMKEGLLEKGLMGISRLLERWP